MLEYTCLIASSCIFADCLLSRLSVRVSVTVASARGQVVLRTARLAPGLGWRWCSEFLHVWGDHKNYCLAPYSVISCGVGKLLPPNNTAVWHTVCRRRKYLCYCSHNVTGVAMCMVGPVPKPLVMWYSTALWLVLSVCGVNNTRCR
jgi:hypothetical protein